MEKKDFNDIEIIDDLELQNNVKNETINSDWLSDFQNVEKNKNNIENLNDEIIEIEDLDISQNNKVGESLQVPSPNNKLSTSSVKEMLESVEPTDISENINYKPNLDKKEINEEVEAELDSNRSLMFIIILFSILILFIIFLPTITKIIK